MYTYLWGKKGPYVFKTVYFVKLLQDWLAERMHYSLIDNVSNCVLGVTDRFKRLRDSGETIQKTMSKATSVCQNVYQTATCCYVRVFTVSKTFKSMHA